MDYINSKHLESLLIAEEGLDKNGLLATGMLIGESALIGMGLWFGAKKFENAMNKYKSDKIKKSKSHIQSFDAFLKLNDLYHFDNFDKSDYNKFIMRIINRCSDIIEYGTNELNKTNEFILQCKDIYIKSKHIKPGNDLPKFNSNIFTAKWVSNKQSWIIINDKDVAQAISSMLIPQGLCEELAQRFELFINANLIDFEYDNSNGCIYFTYMPYDQMQKEVEKYIKKQSDDSKCLESLLIAEEGVFGKIKEKAAARKAAKEEQRNKYLEHVSQIHKQIPIVKRDLQTIVNKYKSKYPKIPIKPYYTIDEDPTFVTVSVFDNEFILNEYDDAYNPEAVKVFNDIYNEVNSHFANTDDLQFTVEIPENACIAVNIK